MGSKNKLKRFEQNKTFSHVIEPGRDELIEGKFPLKGKWKSFFNNSGQVESTLEEIREAIGYGVVKNVGVLKTVKVS